MKILITGACGYVGSSLTPYLLSKGHEIIAIDTQWFGLNLEESKNLTIYKEDVRNLDEKYFEDIETVIHLANIANDPGVDLNPVLSWEVNVLATQKLVEHSVKMGVNQFIYASSGSVYGVKDEPKVTEDLPLVPISVYNKTKMVSERVAMSFLPKINIINVRPATVCGWSPRMRLDVSVNMLTFQALKNKKITVFGGDQVRPNININDMIRVYEHFIQNKNSIESGFYNAGFENISIMKIAEMIADRLEADIEVSESNDPRSYRQDSSKLISTGFKQKFEVSDAIDEIIEKYKNGLISDNDQYHTVRTMKKLNLDK